MQVALFFKICKKFIDINFFFYNKSLQYTNLSYTVVTFFLINFINITVQYTDENFITKKKKKK